MTAKHIPWNQGKWSTEPKLSRVVDERLEVEALEGSDYWEKTLYGFQRASGHALLTAWSDESAVEVSFSLDGLTELYDQAGLMLWHSDSQWIKAGVEINDGVPHLGAVVTDEFSDWSLAPVPEWAGAIVTIRASRAMDAVILRARVGDAAWRTLRVARFAHPEGKSAGPFVCAPQRAGLKVAFTRWVHNAPDADLHTNPPLL
jgi:hypothetical protein